MTITNNNVVAKAAAVVAGLGLVAMSFASFAPAQAQSTTDLQSQINSLLATIASLQAQLGGTTTTSTTFTRDLDIGATGADVTALQTWLISKGFSIPAGATGYFGAQTQAALAAYQAANGITPAAGYFGPITRAKVSASAGTSTGTGTGTGTSTGGLSGGEADLRNFDLQSGNDLREGDTNEEVAVAKFDVDDGDINVQRVTVEFTPTKASGTANQHPWEYVDSLAVYDGSTKIGDVDTGSKSDWDQQDKDSDHGDTYDYYSIDIPVSDVVKEGDSAELSIRADAQGSIDDSDTGQVFKVDVPDNGIRAVDAAGIQQYTGDENDTVNVGFNEAENGDLTLRESSDDPDAGTLVADDTDTSDTFDVFKFDIKNTDDVDADLNSITVHVATTSGSTGIDDVIRKATLTVNGNDIDGDINHDNTIDFDDLDDVTLDANDTTSFTLSIELFGMTNHYAAQTLTFSVDDSDVDAEGSDTGDASEVDGSATSNKQSIVLNGGITASGTDQSASNGSGDTGNTVGNFTIKFDVTAVGDDVYVPDSVASSTASTTAGIVYTDDLAATMGASSTAAITSSADTSSGTGGIGGFIVHDGDTESFTLSVSLKPSATGFYEVGLDAIRFSDNEDLTGLTTLDVDQTDNDFHTDPLQVTGS